MTRLPPSTRPSDARGRRSSAFVRERHPLIGPCRRTTAIEAGRKFYGMPLKSQLRGIVGGLRREVEVEAVEGEGGAAGLDPARMSFLAREDIAASCAGAVDCDIEQVPRIAISLS